MRDGPDPREPRFSFGENWQSFIDVVGPERIEEAECSLVEFLGKDNLAGRRFLDIGCGSGLFSLAAARIGAKVHAFDYDPRSVASARALIERFDLAGEPPVIVEGSVLDRGFMTRLGTFDAVYAWGVLHHTGALCRAFCNVDLVVEPGGLLYIGIYNHQGVTSEVWRAVKRFYSSGKFGRIVATAIFYPVFFLSGLMIDAIKLRDPRHRYREHKRHRGMSLMHDWKDWLGGYPYEPARPETVVSFFENLGYSLVKFSPPPIGFGNNHYVFRKRAS